VKSVNTGYGQKYQVEIVYGKDAKSLSSSYYYSVTLEYDDEGWVNKVIIENNGRREENNVNTNGTSENTNENRINSNETFEHIDENNEEITYVEVQNVVNHY